MMSRDEAGGTELLDRAHDHLRSLTDVVPQTAIILGSGLGGLADKITDSLAVPFGQIPGLVTSTAAGHRGQLLFGRLAGQPIVAMAGRLHRYEGWTNRQIAFPIQLMSTLGARRLIVSNAAGGLNPKLKVGDVVVIRDHIDWIGSAIRPAAAWVADVPMRRAEVYDPEMSAVAMQSAVENRFNAYRGTYLATLGPNYETRAEYRMMRRMGADVAGMSTVPEVLAAAALKMRILGISMVSNVANPDRPVQAHHQEVLEAGKAAEVKMEAIVRSALVCV